MSVPKTIKDMEFIPTAFAAARRGRVATLYPSEHSILVLLQTGAASSTECMAVGGLSTIVSLRSTMTHLRHKLQPLGLTIVGGQKLKGHYALGRLRE